MSPGFNWQALGLLIVQLSRLAMEWYKMVSGDPNGDDERRARKAAALVLDPDKPHQEIDEVVLE